MILNVFLPVIQKGRKCEKLYMIAEYSAGGCNSNSKMDDDKRFLNIVLFINSKMNG